MVRRPGTAPVRHGTEGSGGADGGCANERCPAGGEECLALSVGPLGGATVLRVRRQRIFEQGLGAVDRRALCGRRHHPRARPRRAHRGPRRQPRRARRRPGPETSVAFAGRGGQRHCQSPGQRGGTGEGDQSRRGCDEVWPVHHSVQTPGPRSPHHRLVTPSTHPGAAQSALSSARRRQAPRTGTAIASAARPFAQPQAERRARPARGGATGPAQLRPRPGGRRHRSRLGARACPTRRSGRPWYLRDHHGPSRRR